MMDAIDFLEQLGRNARLRHAPTPELERVLAASGIDPELRSALLTDDAVRLGELLGAQPNICCLIEKPDQEDDEEEEEETRGRRRGRAPALVPLPHHAVPTHSSRLRCGRPARLVSGGLAVVCALFAAGALALTSQEADQLLHEADGLKSSDPTQFARLLQQLDSQTGTLSQAQQQYLSYLKGWQFAYAGDYARAVPLLQSIIDQSKDVTLRFRATATVANVQAVATQYDEAFSQLGSLLALLPEVADKDARQQGMAVVGYLYNQVGEYDLGLSYADRIVSEDPSGRGVCRSYHMRLEALYRSGRLRGDVAQFLNAHRHVRGDRRAAASERDPHVHRALVHRSGPQSRRHRAAEPALRRNARLALSTPDLRIRIDPRDRLPQQRRPGSGAAVRAARDRRRAQPKPVHRAGRERISPAVPARAGAGRYRTPRSRTTRSTRPPTRVTSTT